MNRYTVQLFRPDRHTTHIKTVSGTSHTTRDGWFTVLHDNDVVATCPVARVLWVEVDKERAPASVREVLPPNAGTE